MKDESESGIVASVEQLAVSIIDFVEVVNTQLLVAAADDATRAIASA